MSKIWETDFDPYEVLQACVENIHALSETMISMNKVLDMRHREIIILKQQLDSQKEAIKELNAYKAHTALQHLTIDDLKQQVRTLELTVADMKGIRLQ